MTMNDEWKFSYLFIGLAVGALGSLMAVLLVHKQSREVIGERRGKSLPYQNQQAGESSETADADSREAENQAYQEDRRENLGG